MEAYEVSEEDKKKIRESFKVTEEEVGVKIQELKEWIQTMPNLPPETQDEEYLNVILLRSKFDLNYAKKNIENYFRCMSKYPEVFEKLGNYKLSEEAGVAIATVKITPQFERIGIMKLCPKIIAHKKFDINQMIMVIVTTGVIMFNNDYVASVRFLLDFEDFTILDLFRVNIRDLFKLMYISENILKQRISGIELLNAPRIMSGLLAVAKIVLKPKMFARVTAHKNISSVYNNIPKEYLPCDYGGDEESTEKLTELWDKITETHRPVFQKLANYVKNKKNA